MPKNKLTDYSATNASNTDVGGINIDEGMLPSSVNDAIREVMTHLKEFEDGTNGITKLSATDAEITGTGAIKVPVGTTAQRPTPAQGQIRYNTTDSSFEGYDGSAWGAIGGGSENSFIVYEYTATASQTTFSGADDNAATLSYTAGNIQVMLNGVVLDPSDYTATNGTSVVLASGAALNDVLNVYAFTSFTVADTVSASAGGTFSANIDVTGTITSDGLTVDGDATISSGTPTLQLTDTGGTNQFATFKQDGSNLKILSRNNTVSGGILMRRNVGGTETDAIQLSANGDVSLYASDGVTQGFFWDASTQSLGLGDTTPNHILDVQGDKDTWVTRIYNSGSDANAQGLLVRSDATAAHDAFALGVYADSGYKFAVKSSGNVGIGTSSPSRPLDVVADVNDNPLRLRARGGGTSAYITFSSNDATTTNALIGNPAANTLAFYTNGFSERLRITSDGKVGIGTSSPYSYGKLTVEAGNGTQLVLDNAGEQYTQMYFLNNGTDKGSIWVDNSLSLFSFTARSGMAMNFYTNNSEAMRIDSSGNVGIGTTSPARTLDIQADSGTNIPLVVRGGSSQTNAFIAIRDTNTTADFNNRIGSVGDNLVLYTNQTERLRIDSSGGISTSANKSGGYALGVFNDGNNSDRYGISIQCGSDSGSGTNYLMGFKDGDGNSVGSITFSGSSTSFNTSSDYRLKENVTADWDATTRLKQLNPVRFNFIADADTTLDGFLAHEVQSVVPEAIAGTHNEVDADGNPVYQGIDQSKLVPLLVKTIQELEARIAALENA